MPFITYVLEDQTGRRYKGVTSNMQRRLSQHQMGQTASTRGMRGTKVVYSETYSTFREARKRELYLKTAAGRRFLKRVLGA